MVSNPALSVLATRKAKLSKNQGHISESYQRYNFYLFGDQFSEYVHNETN